MFLYVPVIIIIRFAENNVLWRIYINFGGGWSKRRCRPIEHRYCCIKWRVFESFMMFHNVLLVVHVLLVIQNVLQCFTMCYNVSQCFTIVSYFTMFNNILGCLVSCDKIGIAASATARPPIADNAAVIGDIAANVMPCKTPSWMETGVTLLLEDNFQTGMERGYMFDLTFFDYS